MLLAHMVTARLGRGVLPLTIGTWIGTTFFGNFGLLVLWNLFFVEDLVCFCHFFNYNLSVPMVRNTHQM